MRNTPRYGIILMISLGAIFLLSYQNIHLGSLSYYLAGLFFEERVTPEILQNAYNNNGIRVLIVPGHDNESYGAQYRGVTEANLNKELGLYLFDFLSADKKMSPFITRNATGAYHEWFSTYIKNDSVSIRAFRDRVVSTMRSAFKQKAVTKNTKVRHNPAADNTSINLYGINKWANENNIDVVLHTHFNDYPGHRYDEPGAYHGFAVYVPEGQLPNSRASRALAEAIRTQLEHFFPGSDFPKEKGVVIEDQQLIAVGSNASRDGVSILIEYGYIYEPQWADVATRSAMLQELAYQTYRGIKNYFPAEGWSTCLSAERTCGGDRQYDTTLLPHQWEKQFEYQERSTDVLSLQLALAKEGLYPPAGKTIADCPITGYFADCTKEAFETFKQRYGEDYLATLNQKYGK